VDDEDLTLDTRDNEFGFWSDYLATVDGIEYRCHSLSAYDNVGNLFGIEVTDSGSYGKTTVQVEDIAVAVKAFTEHVGITPKVWLFNWQW
jgi:hypothetical protein